MVKSQQNAIIIAKLVEKLADMPNVQATIGAAMDTTYNVHIKYTLA
jgi:hypothetical protein